MGGGELGELRGEEGGKKIVWGEGGREGLSHLCFQNKLRSSSIVLD